MRKLIVSIHSTANDIVTGPPTGDETEWTWAGAGIQESLDSFWSLLADVDTIVLGHATYDDLVRKWPNFSGGPDVSEVLQRIADKVNTTPKLVATRSGTAGPLPWGRYEPAAWLAGADVTDRVADLKSGLGGSIVTFGSPTLVQSLTNARLVDEYRILVHPVIMHEGRRLFDHLDGRTDLRVADTEVFPCGAMSITYVPESARPDPAGRA